MRSTRILTIVFLFISLGVAAYLFQSIRSEVIDRAKTDKLEAKVIEKLKMIRRTQRAYRSTYGTYAGEWDSLVHFLKEGMLYTTVRHEEVTTLDYGADQVHIKIDTIGMTPVRDSLFKASVYPNFDPEQLPYVPHVADTKFSLFIGKIERSGTTVDVIEVKDPAPTNPRRSKDHKARSMKPLHFGSKTSTTLSGNWE